MELAKGEHSTVIFDDDGRDVMHDFRLVNLIGAHGPLRVAILPADQDPEKYGLQCYVNKATDIHYTVDQLKRQLILTIEPTEHDLERNNMDNRSRLKDQRRTRMMSIAPSKT